MARKLKFGKAVALTIHVASGKEIPALWDDDNEARSFARGAAKQYQARYYRLYTETGSFLAEAPTEIEAVF